MPDGPAPLAATYRLLTRLCPPLAVSITDEKFSREGYAPVRHADEDGPQGAAVRLGVPSAVGAFADGEADRAEAAHGRRPRREVAASRFAHHYLWSVGLLFTGPWFLTGRVPSIPGDAVTADPGTGAFTLDVAAVTTSAPAAAEGPAALRAAVAAHIAPALAAIAPVARRGRHAMWGMATDDLASGLWFLGRARDDEAAGLRAAAALLPGGTPPFPGAAAFRVLRGPSGRAHPTRTRLGCCLQYAITPAAPCLTCPRLTDAERLRRLEAG